ncbi:MAG: polyprenyl diphosphate synthase [Alphaproteobacteria bacterium]
MFLDKIPNHVAIIMDGNGRWALKHNLPTIKGHKKGARRVREIITRAAECGISYITLYAFSSENWSRSSTWIAEFMDLLRWYLNHEISKLIKNNVKIRVIGDSSRFDEDIQKMIKNIEEKTKNNTGIIVLMALSYGGRDDLLRAFRKLAILIQQSMCNPEELGIEDISNSLDTKGIPDPDLMIRTSGEQRISNFLLWQMAYTEFIFTPILWPDFTKEEFNKALFEFQIRKRNFGT